jgi:hypothetical protein
MQTEKDHDQPDGDPDASHQPPAMSRMMWMRIGE